MERATPNGQLGRSVPAPRRPTEVGGSGETGRGRDTGQLPGITAPRRPRRPSPSAGRALAWSDGRSAAARDVRDQPLPRRRGRTPFPLAVFISCRLPLFTSDFRGTARAPAPPPPCASTDGSDSAKATEASCEEGDIGRRMVLRDHLYRGDARGRPSRNQLSVNSQEIFSSSSLTPNLYPQSGPVHSGIPQPDDESAQRRLMGSHSAPGNSVG
jgi:hypothetical protein